nr:acid phosphatase/vanadium-dependent haloperoxidas proteine-related [Tanacetum cinerariifolium]
MDHLETFEGLSCLQIETLVYTSQRYLQHLENGSREGFFSWRWSWCRQRTCRPNLVELAPWEEKSIAFWRTPHKPFTKYVFEAAMEENDGPDANDYSPDEFDLSEDATGYKEHRWDIEQLIGSGGMPQLHSATVTALAIVVGLHDGLGGSTFATALILACIVMYDATGVRLHAGRQAEVLNSIVFELPAEHPLGETILTVTAIQPSSSRSWHAIIQTNDYADHRNTSALCIVRRKWIEQVTKRGFSKNDSFGGFL